MNNDKSIYNETELDQITDQITDQNKSQTYKNQSDVLIYTIEDVNTYYANCLRRSMIRDIPVLAIDVVQFEVNTGSLIDEMIAHRLGLVVLNDDNIGDKIIFTLDVTCEKEWMYVTSGMLVSSQDNVYPVHKNIIITKLFRHERIKAKCFVKKGTGKEHAKWTPVSAIGYKIFNLKDEKMLIQLSIESVGGMSPQTILEQGQKMMGIEKNHLNKFKAGYGK